MKNMFRSILAILALAWTLPSLAADQAATPAADVPAVIQPEAEASAEQPGWVAQKWAAVKHSYEEAKEAVAEKFSSDDEAAEGTESQKADTEVTAAKEPQTKEQAVKN